MKFHKIGYLIYMAIAFGLLTSCITHKSTFEGEALPKSSDWLKNHGKQEASNTLTTFLADTTETTGMQILVGGIVIYEYGNVSQVSYIASCRKSVLSMLYGKYVEDGSLDLDNDIGSLGIDEKDGLLASEKEATIRDIISSRSGVFHLPANGGYDVANIKERGSVKHGEYFVYNNWDFNVAGYILEQHTGRSVYEELERQLAILLGFQDWNIKNQKKRHKKKNSQYPAYHIYVSTRDMAKIGQLMLNNGLWNGKQVISKNWIKTSTNEITSSEVIHARSPLYPQIGIKMAYGYMWWLIQDYEFNDLLKGAYTASGYGGQYITIIPKAEMIIAHKNKIKSLGPYRIATWRST